MLARRKMKSKDLASAIGITEANLSWLKQGKVKGVRFGTLEPFAWYWNASQVNCCTSSTNKLKPASVCSSGLK